MGGCQICKVDTISIHLQYFARQIRLKSESTTVQLYENSAAIIASEFENTVSLDADIVGIVRPLCKFLIWRKMFEILH